jgi:hypothetical protein
MGAFWLLWPAMVIGICGLAVLLSMHVQHGVDEVRSDLTRGNLIGLAAVLIAPPACLTILWYRMRGRRRAKRSIPL